MKYLVGVLFSFPLFVFAQAVTDVTTNSINGQFSKVTLTGSGFGFKAPPLLLDQANKAYEKGVLNTFNSRYSNNDSIRRSTDPQSVWKSVSVINGAETVFMSKDPTKLRYAKNEAVYMGKGPRAFLDNPRVHPKDGTPLESKKLYVSWWFLEENDTRFYYQFHLTDISPNFSPVANDEFTVAVDPDWSKIASVGGRVLAYDAASKILHLEFRGPNEDVKATTKIIKLTKNSSTAVLASKSETNGSNKYIRIWEDTLGGADSFRLSWTNTQLYTSDLSVWPNSPVLANQWNHMEIFIDQDAKKIETRVNGKVDQVGAYTVQQDKAGYSPTIGLIGFDASVALLQNTWWDDIYLDTSFKRVTIGNASKHSAVTHEEVQLTSIWTDNQIVFDVNFGSLDRGEYSYIYIYSESGVPNEVGIKFESRPLPPDKK